MRTRRPSAVLLMMYVDSQCESCHHLNANMGVDIGHLIDRSKQQPLELTLTLLLLLRMPFFFLNLLGAVDQALGAQQST